MAEKIYECQICKDSGFVMKVMEDGYEYATPCKCREIKIAKDRLKRSGLAKEFTDKSFENYVTGDNAQLIDAKKTAERFANSIDEGNVNESHSLLLCGQVGAGKTHLGTACSMSLINKGIAVIYMGYREEMTSIKSKILDENAYSKEINKFKNAPVLFIDDFLKGKLTESDVNVIYEIVNYRYNNKLPVIISTEKTLDELINFDEAIASRLIEMCTGYIVVFTGKELNYRLYRGGAA